MREETHKMDQKSSRPEAQSSSGSSSSNQKPNSVGEALSRGKDALSDTANEAARSSGSDIQAIRNDLNSLKDTLSRFMSQASLQALNQLAMLRQILQGRSVMPRAISLTGVANLLLPPETKQKPSLPSLRQWPVEIRLARSPERWQSEC
jgi:hypothetical protein